MDEIAEKGLAAHWRYKNSDVEEDHELEVWLDTIREVLNHPDSKGMEFLNTVHLSLYAHDITAFTPRVDRSRYRSMLASSTSPTPYTPI